MAPIKYAKTQLNPIILLRGIELRPADRQTDIQKLSLKPFFLTQGVLKRKDLMEISKFIFHIIKLIPSHLWWECKNDFVNLDKAFSKCINKMYFFYWVQKSEAVLTF